MKHKHYPRSGGGRLAQNPARTLDCLALGALSGLPADAHGRIQGGIA